jgi:hypothetical protein
MAVLTAVLTHLDARAVRRQLDYLGDLAPASRFVVCHGGSRKDFDDLDDADAIFVDDPSLRGPHFAKSINQTLYALNERHVRGDPSVDWVYVIEYDHLILRGDFDGALVGVAERTGAGLLGKWASVRNDTNWSHYLAARDDAELNRFIEAISRRDDPRVRLGCLGTGMFFRRDAFDAFCSLEGAPEAYVELFVPTAVHHLGFDVVDVDAVADLYADVRWLPEFGVDEARAARRAGRTFVHPFKTLDRLDAVASG